MCGIICSAPPANTAADIAAFPVSLSQWRCAVEGLPAPTTVKACAAMVMGKSDARLNNLDGDDPVVADGIACPDMYALVPSKHTSWHLHC